MISKLILMMMMWNDVAMPHMHGMMHGDDVALHIAQYV